MCFSMATAFTETIICGNNACAEFNEESRVYAIIPPLYYWQLQITAYFARLNFLNTEKSIKRC